MNRRSFLSLLGLGFAAPLVTVTGKPEAPSLSKPISLSRVFLTPDEYYRPDWFSLEEVNALMRRWRKVNPGVCHNHLLLLGRMERECLLSLEWQGSVTREFAARATKEDYYRMSPKFLHDEIRAGRGELFGFQIIHIDSPHHCELV